MQLKHSKNKKKNVEETTVHTMMVQETTVQETSEEDTTQEESAEVVDREVVEEFLKMRYQQKMRRHLNFRQGSLRTSLSHMMDRREK